jgi:acetyltransferase-like isoleucine patch superfamily enzyme
MKALKKLIALLLNCLSYFIPIRLYILCKSKIYNHWILRQIGVVGANVNISLDCTLVGGKYIIIKKGTFIAAHVTLTAWDNYLNQRFTPKIEIGKNVSFGEYNHITCINSIRIGDGVLTGRWVTITDNSHGRFEDDQLGIVPAFRPMISKGPTIIGDRVWIGDKATILPGVTIGESCIVAANTVVTKDIPPFSLVAGNPAKIIKQIDGNI